jgi:3-isopropylmalate dehydratase small subunit
MEHLEINNFKKLLSLPGKPHDTSELPSDPVWIDSAFIGSCTNGRLKDIQLAACILKGRKIAPHVVLKIVPATNKVWEQALEAGYIEDLKEAGALISNAGCAGCAAGQVGQNGPGEVTMSTGNRNFPGKQGQGEVYLAAPDVVAASAIAGYITSPDAIPDRIPLRPFKKAQVIHTAQSKKTSGQDKATVFRGKVWVIDMDDIDTDMIFHNRHLSITDPEEMGVHTFGNLEGYTDFSKKAKQGDIIITGKNFGAGSSRQQAVECFKTLGISAIVAESFGAIYERNAINAAFPILTGDTLLDSGIRNGDHAELDIEKGSLAIPAKHIQLKLTPFSDVQMEIYKENGLF